MSNSDGSSKAYEGRQEADNARTIEQPDLIRIELPAARQGYASAIGTTVRTADGRVLPGVTKITLHPLDAESLLTAEIEICVTLADFEAHPLLGVDTLVRSAAMQGLKVFDAHGTELTCEPEEAVAILSSGRVHHPRIQQGEGDK